jgi:hypothetical protein
MPRDRDASPQGVNRTTLEDVFLKVNELKINATVATPCAPTGTVVPATRFSSMIGMLNKKMIAAKRGCCFSSCQCLFPPSARRASRTNPMLCCARGVRSCAHLHMVRRPDGDMHARATSHMRHSPHLTSSCALDRSLVACSSAQSRCS